MPTTSGVAAALGLSSPPVDDGRRSPVFGGGAVAIGVGEGSRSARSQLNLLLSMLIMLMERE